MSILTRIKRRGISGAIRYAMLKFLHIDKQQEEIDTLRYFLNKYCDITSIPPTDDEDLRNVQLLIFEMMKVFDAECKKHGLKYWIDSGNLLGAHRHGGSIPWDDDADLCMLREDYIKVLPLMAEELAKYGIDIVWKGHFDDCGKLERLALSYKVLETGGWVDIFPVDIYENAGGEVGIDQVRKITADYRKYYLTQDKDNTDAILTHKAKMYGDYVQTAYDGEYKGICVFYPEFNADPLVLDEKCVFPLGTCLYEGYTFPAPANMHEYLKMYYGEHYMSFPKSGVEHHLDDAGLDVKSRAKRAGIDMSKEIEYMRGVYEQIKDN